MYPLISYHLHRQTHSERCALALCRHNIYSAAEQRHNLASDSESEAHALLALSAGQTREGVEHTLQFFGCHAAASVAHAQRHPTVQNGYADTHLALVGIFDSVAHEVVHNLLDAERIRTAEHILRNVYIRHQAQLFSHSQRLHLRHTLADERSRLEAHLVSLRLSALQLMIVEQRRHQLQQMISRARYALQVAHSLRTVYILAEQVDETGNRRRRRLYVVRDGEQQSLSLLHDALRLRLRFKNALTVAALALYVSEDVHHENRRRENRQQSQHRNSHDHGTSRTDSLAHNTLQGVVLVALYVLQQLPCALRQLNAHQLQTVVSRTDDVLLAVVGALLLAMNLGKRISHRVGDVQSVMDGVGRRLMRQSGSAYGVGALLAEGVAQASEEAAFRLHHLVNRLVLFVALLRLWTNHYRVASAVQRLHLIVVIDVAAVVFQYVHHEQRVLAFRY